MRIFQYTLLAAALVLLASTSLLAQYTTPISFWLNPQFTAPTAMSAYEYKQVSAHYQKQGLAGNIGGRSMILSGQLPLLSGRNTQFGTLGLNIVRQESGSAYLFSTSGAMFTYNYTASLSRQHHLVGGIQGGYFSRRIDWNKVTTRNQFGDGQLNPDRDHGEKFFDYQSQAFTTNIGLGYYLTDAKGEQRLHVGAGMINANKGRFTYLENDENQAEPVRWIVYSNMRLISTPFYELGTNMYWQRESGFNDFVAGLQLNKGINPRKTVAEEHLGLGVYYSPDHTATLAMQLMRQNILLGLSYNIPFGNQNLHGLQNAAEVTLGWRINKTGSKAFYKGGTYRGKMPSYQAKKRSPRQLSRKAPAIKYKANRKSVRTYNKNTNKRFGVGRTKKFSKKVSSYKSKANRKKPSYKRKVSKKSKFSNRYKKALRKTQRSKKVNKWRPKNRRPFGM